MSDWKQPPEFAADEIPMVVWDRKALDTAVGGRRKAPPAPPGFIPQRLKGAMQDYVPRQAHTIKKRREMDERADLLVSGAMTRQQIADAYGVSMGSIKEQARNLAAKGGPDGRTRASTEAESRRGTRREPGQGQATREREGSAEAAA